MSTTKHTPGPWIQDEGNPLCIGTPKPWYPRQVYHIVAMLEGGKEYTANHNETAEANARLIAAAPDLLEALMACRGQWIHSVNADKCLAAIAKATGKEAERLTPAASEDVRQRAERMRAAPKGAGASVEGETRVRVPEAMDRGCDCSGCYCGNSGDAESVGYADGWNAFRAEMLAALRSEAQGGEVREIDLAIETFRPEWQNEEGAPAGVRIVDAIGVTVTAVCEYTLAGNKAVAMAAVKAARAARRGEGGE